MTVTDPDTQMDESPETAASAGVDAPEPDTSDPAPEPPAAASAEATAESGSGPPDAAPGTDGDGSPGAEAATPATFDDLGGATVAVGATANLELLYDLSLPLTLAALGPLLAIIIVVRLLGPGIMRRTRAVQ